MLRQRLITALLLAPLLLWVVLWAPHAVAVVVITVVVALGAWEWSQFCVASGNQALRVFYALIVLGSLWGIDLWAARDLAAVLLCAAGWWVLAMLWIMLAPLRHHRPLAAAAGIAALAPTWLALVRLHAASDGLLLFFLVLIFAADIGAYFVGRRFGRVKLAPQVSPGKSWEGVFGGMAAAVAVAVAGGYWFDVRPLAFVPLCMAVVAASVIGDLTESMFKRHVGLKDSSSLLPGHGGMLDRIDSITSAAPLFALGSTWMGLL
jgi:phosphatidate cytidylyltransferase